jgi:DNA-binding transcriptional MerR regulator
MTTERNKHADRELMRISQAARAAGVSAQTLEYYIMLGLVEPLGLPDRRGRFFDAGHVTRIRLIHKLNATGYTLQEIREIHLRRH